MTTPNQGSSGDTSHVLIVDDDTGLCELLAEYLSSEGFTVDSAYDGVEGKTKALSGNYDLVILDVMLPRVGGFDVLRGLRAKSSVPVLMLTAKGDDVDRIVGLEMGADDYLPKPFNSRELLARIRAVLRRSGQKVDNHSAKASLSELRIDDIEMDPGTLEVLRRGEPVELTATEFKLLEILVRNAGVILSRERLTETVLGRTLSPYDRSIDVHVSKLRRKLGSKAGGAERVRSVRNAGYIYVLSSSD